MAATAEIITKPVASAISLRWIISARDDAIWFIGSVVSSYVLLILYVSGLVPLVPMVAAWAILIDAPHVFGTFSRTYFDRTERKNRARLLWGSLLFFAIGPVMVLAGAGLVFFFVAALWAYYHLVKQHYGFMVLYKKKNGDLARVGKLNVPKYLLLAAAIPMHWIVLLTPMPHKPIAIVAILTIYHNFQYHRLIWFHNQKYRNGREKYGAAELISRRVLLYVAFGILFGIIYQGPRQLLKSQLVISFLWGYAFIHYYLDSKIWRVRRDPSVSKALNI